MIVNMHRQDDKLSCILAEMKKRRLENNKESNHKTIINFENLS